MRIYLMGLTEYECPSCGGAMEFNTKEQMLKCPFCDTKIRVEDYVAPREEEQNSDGLADSNEWMHEQAEEAPSSNWKEGETSGMVVYSCQSCGGEIIASENEGSLTCPFCSNNVVVKEKWEGDLRPDYVIPFKKNKEEAMKAYKNFVKHKLLLPGVFSEENHIDKIRGIYIPYWLYDAKIEGDYKFRGQKVRTWSDSNYHYTETSNYRIDRAGSESFEHVPSDASREMPDDLMESIEPFSFSDAVPFNSAYLAGFLANRYDVQSDETKERILKRMENTVASDIRATLGNYSSISEITHNVQVKNLRHKYALYPVWILNTTFKDKPYLFAMNAQTGKFVGNLPVSVPRAIVCFLVSFLGFTAIAVLVTLFMILM